MHNNVSDVRNYFINELKAERFTEDRNGGKTIELLNASFIANEDAIFGTVNREYVDAELAWYESESRNINDIYGPDKEPPKAWQMTANSNGEINSNYGHLIYNGGHWNQYDSALKTLVESPDSRRAIMIYNRPSIQFEYNWNDINDFICTNAVSYYIRENQLNVVVQMRSNDVIFGYKNDLAWQQHVQSKFLNDYNDITGSKLTAGQIHWQVANLHVYEKHFHLV
jgi:thymidylate synthase